MAAVAVSAKPQSRPHRAVAAASRKRAGVVVAYNWQKIINYAGHCTLRGLGNLNLCQKPVHFF